MNKVKIDFNDHEHNRMLGLETQIIDLYDKLKEIGEQALGIDKVNMAELLRSNASEYLTNEYAELYLQEYPIHLDKEHIFLSQTKVSLEAVRQLKNEIESCMSKMNKYAPTINADGIKSNIKKSDFNIYLDESKKDHYNALNNLIDAIDEMKKYNVPSRTAHVIKAFPDLLFDGTGVKINTHRFR